MRAKPFGSRGQVRGSGREPGIEATGVPRGDEIRWLKRRLQRVEHALEPLVEDLRRGD